jgi:hypothetical protein
MQILSVFWLDVINIYINKNFLKFRFIWCFLWSPSKPPKIQPKIQRIFKIYKGKIFPMRFSIFLIFKPTSDQHVWLLRSRGSFRHKIDKFDPCNISMSYASYVIICHIMTNDAYEIEIWHKSNLSILVSKWPSGPQQSHPFIRFWLTNNLKRKKLKNTLEIFSLYKFWKSFVFSVEFSVALRVIKETTK